MPYLASDFLSISIFEVKVSNFTRKFTYFTANKEVCQPKIINFCDLEEIGQKNENYGHRSHISYEKADYAENLLVELEPAAVGKLVVEVLRFHLPADEQHAEQAPQRQQEVAAE